MRENRQTDIHIYRQTDRNADHNTSHPCIPAANYNKRRNTLRKTGYDTIQSNREYLACDNKLMDSQL